MNPGGRGGESVVFASDRVFSPVLRVGGEPARVYVEKGVVTRIERAVAGGAADTPRSEVIDLGARWLLPGLVDSHVHLNEPGRVEWEGLETGTYAAAAGGITTLVDMPLNSDPVTTTLEALRCKRRSASGKLAVDLGYFGGVVPANSAGRRELDALRELVDSGEVLGCKAFLCFSGIDEFPAVGEAELRLAMPVLKAAGIPLVAHAEIECPLPPEIQKNGLAAHPRSYRAYLESRPRKFENEAVRLLIRLCRETGCRVHVVHLSSSDVLPEIEAARGEGLPFSAETCPHYLYFAAEDIPDGRTEFKCAPPIHERENREKLWEGLRAGTIDFVVADHSPCAPAFKRLEEGDFARAWGGIASLQLGLSVVATEAARRGFQFDQVLSWMSARPARLLSLPRGEIAPGRSADFTAWNPDEVWSPVASEMLHRHPLTPYLGARLTGRVEATWLRGEIVFDRRGGKPLRGLRSTRLGREILQKTR